MSKYGVLGAISSVECILIDFSTEIRPFCTDRMLEL